MNPIELESDLNQETNWWFVKVIQTKIWKTYPRESDVQSKASTKKSFIRARHSNKTFTSKN